MNEGAHFISSSPLHACGSHDHRHHPLPAQITINGGETLKGELTCAPNAKNPRDLDISIGYQFDGENSQCDFTQEYRMR